MALIAVRMNKSYLAANEAYATLDRLFYSLIDLFADYKTGKEIRLYKEQHLIGKIATEKILTDGEKTLKQISMRTAKTSSIVAVMGAFVAFGVYVFIGVKGNLGLFDIGALVMYCGAFMQIVNGVMLIANTLGKLAEILPLARIYFEIIECTDSKQYGTRTLDGDRFEIEFKNVSFKYPGANQYALENVSIKIENGSHLAVVGRNGSGKTTLLRAMTRTLPCRSGNILLDDRSIASYGRKEFARTAAFMPQSRPVPGITVRALVAHGRFPYLGFSRRMTAQDTAAVEQAMRRTGTLDWANRDVRALSGGERQRVYLAMALAQGGTTILLDEPGAFLDVRAQFELLDLLRSVAAGGKAVVLVMHELPQAMQYADRIALLGGGRLLGCDTSAALAATGAVDRVFGVRLCRAPDGVWYVKAEGQANSGSAEC